MSKQQPYRTPAPKPAPEAPAPPPAPERWCCRCAHYVLRDDGSPGECRAHPPSPGRFQSDAGQFPRVVANWSCGEWRAGQ